MWVSDLGKVKSLSNSQRLIHVLGAGKLVLTKSSCSSGGGTGIREQGSTRSRDECPGKTVAGGTRLEAPRCTFLAGKV